MELSLLAVLACIGLLAGIAQWVAWWMRLPAILFLLLFGLLAGPVTGWLNPDALFGDLLFPIISLSVAVILFEGSLTLRFSELPGIGHTVRNLVTVGALITWVITAVLAHFVIGFDVKLAILFGAVVVVTGPTVIVPMLRSVRPNRRISDILRWEGIVIDPLGALFAVLAFNLLVSTEAADAVSGAIELFAGIVITGTVLGLAAGFGLGEVLKRYLIPEYLRSPLTLILVFFVFALAEEFAHESGLLAVTVFGMTLANLKGVEVEDILDFKESLTVVLIGGLFIILAARVDLNAVFSVGWEALLLLAGIMLVARPLAVFTSSIGSELTVQEKLMVSWIGPRGIVCAAVAAVFALRLDEIGADKAELLVPMAFLVIIGTVVIQSMTSKYLAHLLGVRDPAPSGFLILGGGRVARMLASALVQHDVRVVVADSHWDNIRIARMEGLETYYGNPVSEHADRYLDLSGVGNLISLSGRINFDVVATLHFRSAFGHDRIFELPSAAEGAQNDKHRVSPRLRGQRLFGADATYNQLDGWLRAGATVRVTRLTDEFDLAAYEQKYQDAYVLLFCIDPNGRVRLVTATSDLAPGADWQIVSLVKVESATTV